ncbi:MAG: hypothetical protein WA118_08915 [Carboxydocellales bacterium]
MSENQELKWYQKTWFIVIMLIFLFPAGLILMWWNKKFSNNVRIIITVMFGIFIILSSIDKSQEKKEALALIAQAETLIHQNKIQEALASVNKSKQINISEVENSAKSLEEKINLLQSDEFMKKTLAEMSNKDFELLKNGELKIAFIDHQDLNNLFLSKLRNNIDKRAIYIKELQDKKVQEEAAVARQKKEQEAQERKNMIEKQFSAWDGSHITLSKYIKESMNDPDSYEHIKTVYRDMNDYLMVTTTFRGANAFGGVVKNSVTAKVALNGDIIEIMNQ